MNIKRILFLLLAASIIAGPAYAKNDKNKPLPPGLHKKVMKGKPLPPGWQKKLAKGDILDSSIYARGKILVPVGSKGLITIEVEGTRFKLHADTRKIIDIF